MDKLHQVKAKLEEMKAKYNFERENENNPNHSDGFGMFYSGFFTCLKEISFFINTLEMKEMDSSFELKEVEKEVNLKEETEAQIRFLNGHHKLEDGKRWYTGTYEELSHFAKYFYELGINAQERRTEK